MSTRIDMQNRVLAMLESFRNLFYSCYPFYPPPPSPLSPAFRRSLTKKEIENVRLKTWPVEEINHTIKGLASDENLVLDEAQFLKLCSDVERDLDKVCPFKLEEEYDFCIICCRLDMEEASAVSLELQEKFCLSGCVVWDNVSFGRDEFIAFEEVVDKSSKVIFFLTENLKNDPVCCFLANNTFVGYHAKAKNKSVPLLDKQDTEVTEELRVINKLVWDNALHKETSLKWIFSDKVKSEKLNRRRTNEKVKDEERLKLLIEIFKIKAKEYAV